MHKENVITHTKSAVDAVTEKLTQLDALSKQAEVITPPSIPLLPMNTNEVLSKTEAAVVAVESKLQELTDLEQKAAQLDQEIAALTQGEQDILASNKADEIKTKKLIEARTIREVKASNLSKLKNEIAAIEGEAIALGLYANNFIGALRDALVASRTERVLEGLTQLFKPNVLLELKRFASFSLLVDEVEGNGHDRFIWVPSRLDMCLDNCKKLRAEFNRLSAMTESEPSIEIITSEGWTVPAVWGRRQDVQFLGALA